MNVKFFSQRVLSTIILNVLVLGLLFGTNAGAGANDYQANKITSEDKANLKRLDDKLYKLINKSKSFEDKKISDFIFKNLSYDLDYSRLTVTASTSATTLNSSTYDGDTNRNKLQAGVTLSYPLFDKKEENDRKKTIITVKQKISSDVKNYLLLVAKLEDQQIALIINQQLEIRAKARKLEGVGGFDEWLKVISDIKTTKEAISKTVIEKQEAKEILMRPLRTTYKTTTS